ncbi:hypothetical protein GEMRC1_008907 [Eukaryota sp. GEM-RC1]
MATFRVFLQSNTFHAVPEDLPLLLSLTSLFKSEVRSIFLHAKTSFNDTLVPRNFLNAITGLRISLENRNDLEIIDNSALWFPSLFQLYVSVTFDSSISMLLIKKLKVDTRITSINLSWSSVGNEGARALAEALKVNDTLTSVVLYRNSIGDEGVNSLAEVLKLNTSIQRIDLTSNSIGDKGIKELADALKVNTTVTNIFFKGKFYWR